MIIDLTNVANALDYSSNTSIQEDIAIIGCIQAIEQLQDTSPHIYADLANEYHLPKSFSTTGTGEPS